MGLCKCPRKKVTTLYCFEHRVNVCEHCLVENHSKCVIQSYLLWLEDSDYDPNCLFCKFPLALEEAEVVRLPCLHVFHWQCFNRWASSMPPTTAPAGYTCPTCQGPVFPKPNQVSPVLTQLRGFLERANWARAGLGLDLLPELNNMPYPDAHMIPQPTKFAAPESKQLASAYRDPDEIFAMTRKQNNGPSLSLSAHEGQSATTHLLNKSRDADENKYARRSAGEWCARWLKSRSSVPSPSSRRWSWKRLLFTFIISAMLVLTIGGILFRAGRDSAQSDPFLDPLANPNIHVDRISDER